MGDSQSVRRELFRILNLEGLLSHGAENILTEVTKNGTAQASNGCGSLRMFDLRIGIYIYV